MFMLTIEKIRGVFQIIHMIAGTTNGEVGLVAYEVWNS